MKAASVEADMYLGALFGGGKKEEIEVLAKIGRILGILATLRDDLVDVFDIEELNMRLAVKDLPLPLIFLIYIFNGFKRMAMPTIARKNFSVLNS